MELNQIYFLKNVLKKNVKDITNLFEASKESNISKAKYQTKIENALRYNNYHQIIFLPFFGYSFEDNEASELMKKLSGLSQKDLNFTPPPPKRAKTETSGNSSGNISLYTFLTQPLIETKNKLVEVIIKFTIILWLTFVFR